MQESSRKPRAGSYSLYLPFCTLSLVHWRNQGERLLPPPTALKKSKPPSVIQRLKRRKMLWPTKQEESHIFTEGNALRAVLVAQTNHSSQWVHTFCCTTTAAITGFIRVLFSFRGVISEFSTTMSCIQHNPAAWAVYKTFCSALDWKPKLFAV